ncbi:PepSY domain-containing protein [Millisia brevis]|uniref:PepSY domain-containing protein n=1 Tax=Millisia brevis TaxID=264148 RepID=UPI000829B932|nr:PepSY domain-containing protein [Millisia brevis]
MTITLRPVLSLSAAVAIGLALTACGGSTDGEPTAAVSTTTAATETATTTTSTATTSTATASAASDPIAAIATAEAEVGGVAYEIDDADNDSSWEVGVRTGDTAREVLIGPDGAVVRVEDESLDDDDRRALDAARIGLAEAITTALNETGGVLDDAEFEEENGAFHIEVSVDRVDGRDDVDVHIDPVSGAIIRID